jgi:hypothetical protein
MLLASSLHTWRLALKHPDRKASVRSFMIVLRLKNGFDHN